MGKLAELTLRIGEWLGLEPYQTQYTVKFIISVIIITYMYRVIIRGKT
jgi:hypothetical protein